MSATATACFICQDECTGNLVAEFEQQMQPLCPDCFMGISNGLDILKQLSVTGETPDK